jgi:hypothetical protein
MTAVLALTTPMPDLLGTCPADLLPFESERLDSTPAEARERADRLRAGIVRYAEMRQDIADAFACRDWLALGYQHWAAYVEAEFGEQLAQLARGERREAIADLRGQGMSTRQIANSTGIGQSQVRRDLAEVSPNGSPEKVTGSDGKQHPAKRPERTQTPEPPAASPTAPVAGSGPTSPEPERHLRAVPDPGPTPEQVEAERMEEQRIQIVDRARRRAPRLVAEIRDLITEVVSGMNLGETGLVTPETVAEIRALVDILEARMEATK